MLHKLSSDTVLSILQASHASLDSQLAQLPQSLHADVMLAAFPELKAESSLVLQASKHTTSAMITALSTVSSLRTANHLSLEQVRVPEDSSTKMDMLTHSLHTAVRTNIETLSLQMDSNDATRGYLESIINSLAHNTRFKCLNIISGCMEDLIRCENSSTCASLTKLKGLDSLGFTSSSSTYFESVQEVVEQKFPVALQYQTQLTRFHNRNIMQASPVASFLSNLVSLRHLNILCKADSIAEAQQLAAGLACLSNITELGLGVGSAGMSRALCTQKCSEMRVEFEMELDGVGDTPPFAAVIAAYAHAEGVAAGAGGGAVGAVGAVGDAGPHAEAGGDGGLVVEGDAGGVAGVGIEDDVGGVGDAVGHGEVGGDSGAGGDGGVGGVGRVGGAWGVGGAGGVGGVGGAGGAGGTGGVGGVGGVGGKGSDGGAGGVVGAGGDGGAGCQGGAGGVVCSGGVGYVDGAGGDGGAGALGSNGGTSGAGTVAGANGTGGGGGQGGEIGAGSGSGVGGASGVGNVGDVGGEGGTSAAAAVVDAEYPYLDFPPELQPGFEFDHDQLSTDLNQFIEGQKLVDNDFALNFLEANGAVEDGQVCKIVVESLQHLPLLQQLHVGCVSPHNSAFSTVCPNSVLQTLSNLRSLSIKDKVVGIVRVLELLPSSSLLTKLAFTSTSLSSPDGAVAFRDKLTTLSSLKTLDVAIQFYDKGGVLRRDGFPALFGSLGLKQLAKLSLTLREVCRHPHIGWVTPTHLGASGSVAAGFFAALGAPAKLDSLSLSFGTLNSFRARDSEDPADSLTGVLGTVAAAVNLQQLELSHSSVGESCARSLAQCLRDLTALKTLSLLNAFSDSEAQESFCAEIPSIETLRLERLAISTGRTDPASEDAVQFTAAGFQYLVLALSSMHQLRSLDLHTSCVSAANMQVLAPALAEMEKLKIINLASCVLDEEAVIHLAKCLHRIPTLEQLNVSANDLTEGSIKVLAGA